MIQLQPASLDIWDKKYRLKTKEGRSVDADLDATFQRVARALADVELPALREDCYESFLWALRHGALPAGRILSNAGAMAHKPATSTINCTVSGTIGDSMHDILTSVHDAGLTLKAGCGIGYEFSTLRPKGALVTGAGASTSGPLPFMDIFDALCKTISSAGNRRGAQMATFDISHPDIADFIRAKRQDGRLRQFNLSCLITDEFMQAVRDDSDWLLFFPANRQDLSDPDLEIIYRHWPITEGYQLNESGEVACCVWKRIKARRLWDMIMVSTYDYAEPGFILVDRINDLNNLWWCETIRATNPCGEQPLPPHGSCLLGSINLTHFIVDPFTDQARFDSEQFRKVVTIFTRMLDNVVEIHGLPLHQQAQELTYKRRHGMGITGLGSALTLLRIDYGSPEAVDFTSFIMQMMAVTGWEVGVELAREKGAAPVFDETFTVTQRMLNQRPEMIADGYQVGDQVPGRVLLAHYSRYMAKFPAGLRDQIAQHGCRFSHHTSIAPTGTISLSFGNNCSNGIEPSFAHKYKRNVIREGKNTKEAMEVWSYELWTYRQRIDALAEPGQLPGYFLDADRIPPEQHVDMQAAAQQWVDSSISKTINVPTDFDFDRFKELYRYAWEKGCKGCTTFRFNPEAFQGVLVKEEELANTLYRFTLADGSVVELKGNEEIEYDGEVHTAANLYDALKEGYYGRL
ncbi:MAG: adenosylcobalamin-dependent ribonucleoside-diphosphate reductase [Magnetococcales bacterium]|nr:adenosylcobalamin-dependent ribonucleoside-diphosphate reductase [Magnetococcales bacterium]